MKNYIEIKQDNRFKDGNIKRTGNELRGNAKTIDMNRMEVVQRIRIGNQLNPPIVVSRELGAAIKRMEQP